MPGNKCCLVESSEAPVYVLGLPCVQDLLIAFEYNKTNGMQIEITA